MLDTLADDLLCHVLSHLSVVPLRHAKPTSSHVLRVCRRVLSTRDLATQRFVACIATTVRRSRHRDDRAKIESLAAGLLEMTGAAQPLGESGPDEDEKGETTQDGDAAPRLVESAATGEAGVPSRRAVEN